VSDPELAISVLGWRRASLVGCRRRTLRWLGLLGIADRRKNQRDMQDQNRKTKWFGTGHFVHCPLAQERIAGGVIRAVDVGMAIRATAVEIPDGVQQRRCSWVTTAHVARIAHSWHPHLQHLRVIRAVRLVTRGAVFHDRRVLPEERAPPFRVTTKAVFVHCGLDKLLGVWRAVWVVTTRTRDFALAIRHVRGTLQLGAPHLVAVQTEFRLDFLNATACRQRRDKASVLRQCRL